MSFDFDADPCYIVVKNASRELARGKYEITCMRSAGTRHSIVTLQRVGTDHFTPAFIELTVETATGCVERTTLTAGEFDLEQINLREE
jgi:hypothetical protein